MALAYDTAYDAAQVARNVQRCTVAVVKQAVSVAAESSTTANHTKRTTLATAALNNPDQYGRVFAYAVVSSTGASANMTDAQVQAVVASAWNGYAGV